MSKTILKLSNEVTGLQDVTIKERLRGCMGREVLEYCLYYKKGGWEYKRDFSPNTEMLIDWFDKTFKVKSEWE